MRFVSMLHLYQRCDVWVHAGMTPNTVVLSLKNTSLYLETACLLVSNFYSSSISFLPTNNLISSLSFTIQCPVLIQTLLINNLYTSS
eukprot:UN07400